MAIVFLSTIHLGSTVKFLRPFLRISYSKKKILTKAFALSGFLNKTVLKNYSFTNDFATRFPFVYTLIMYKPEVSLLMSTFVEVELEVPFNTNSPLLL